MGVEVSRALNNPHTMAGVRYRQALKKLRDGGWELVEGGLLLQLGSGGKSTHVITDVAIGPDKKSLYIKTKVGD